MQDVYTTLQNSACIKNYIHSFVNRLSKVQFCSLAATCAWLKWVSNGILHSKIKQDSLVIYAQHKTQFLSNIIESSLQTTYTVNNLITDNQELTEITENHIIYPYLF